MPTPHAEIIAQLNTLLRLTSTEAATARARVSQATTDATRKELTENARKCDQRADAIRSTITDLGGVADVVGLAVGRATTAARLPFEQTIPVIEALLADLALEHQLFDRARLVKVLASQADERKVVALAERLEEAHGATIQWLFTVLGETALGGPAALAPTSLQAAAATARHAATFASTSYVKGVNKAVNSTAGLTAKAQHSVTSTVSDGVDRARVLAASARKIVTVGRDATLAETEKQARKDRANGAARGIHKLREGLGSVAASDLPVARYDNLDATKAAAAVRGLKDTDDIRVVLAYEQAHKNRSAVITTAEKRVREIATELVNS
jgi:hypothetical protein